MKALKEDINRILQQHFKEELAQKPEKLQESLRQEFEGFKKVQTELLDIYNLILTVDSTEESSHQRLLLL